MRSTCDRSAAETGFQIDGRAFADVVRDVGDMHMQLKIPVRQAANEDGVVEVAGGFAVNRDDWQRAVVLPVVKLAGVDDRIELLSLLQHLDGEAVRQVELADHDFDVDAEVVFVAEDFDDAAAWVAGGRRPVGDFDFDDHALKIGPLVTSGLGAEDAITGLSTGRFLPLRRRINEG
jgi:hypothetical protein